MFHSLAFRGKAAGPVEAVYGAVKGGVGLAQVGRHQVQIVQISQGSARMGGAGTNFIPGESHSGVSYLMRLE